MSTVIEAPRAVHADRIFYTGMAVLSACIVLAGFSPTFYARKAELAPLATLYVVHGIVYTLWLALFIAQTGLVAANRRDIHRKLGAAGVVLAGLMLVLGTMVAVESLRLGRAPVPGLDPRSFFALPMHDMFVFPILIAAAVLNRRESESHKRYMLLATIAILDAAIARLPIPALMTIGIPLLFLLQDLLVAVGLVYDKLTRGKVHRAYWWGGGAILASQVLMMALAQTPLWLAFADLFL